MARYSSKDYIPTYGELVSQRDEANTRAQAARDRGFRLGEYEISYNFCGSKYTEKMTAYSKAEAIDLLKESCSMVGIFPYDIEVKTLVEPNVYV